MAVLDVTGITRRRLETQRIRAPVAGGPGEVVSWLTAVQCQDYLGSLWAIGQRTRGATEADVEHAIAERAIVRTWPMRGTLHFVSPRDVRWMLRLLAPRILARCAGRNKLLGVHAAVLKKSRACLEKALAGGRALARPEVYRLLEAAGISAGDQRGLHILIQLAMQGVICFGARKGRQPTFVLLDEWVPRVHGADLAPDEALGTLAARYFASHGPATASDLAWWSGLSLTEARRAIGIAGPALSADGGDGRYLDSAKGAIATTNSPTPACYLLPAFDEYTVGYRDRSAFHDAAYAERTGHGIGRPVVIVRGRVAGTWQRGTTKKSVEVEVRMLEQVSPAVRRAIEAAAHRHGAFLGLPASIQIA